MHRIDFLRIRVNHSVKEQKIGMTEGWSPIKGNVIKISKITSGMERLNRKILLISIYLSVLVDSESEI